MKTLKYQGREYEVLDLRFIDGERTPSLHIIAGIKEKRLMNIVTFDATYFTRTKNVDVGIEAQWITPHMAKVIHDYSAQ